MNVVAIRSDHGKKFENKDFEIFCDENRNSNFSAPGTPQRNGVLEIINRTLQGMGRIMLTESKLPKYFLAEMVNTTCYILTEPFETWAKQDSIKAFEVGPTLNTSKYFDASVSF